MKGKSPLSRSFMRMALDLLSFSTIKSVAEFLNAGLGVVEGSDPALEWQELELKIAQFCE